MNLGTNDIGSVYLGTNAVQKVYLGTNEVWTAETGLLGDYPGAAAAYSLRLLRSGYAGSAIQVRRASDNSTQDIGFSGEELDVATLESFCSGTNGFVTIWYDQSGNGRNATQTTAANQPQIVISGSVITQNGKPAIYGDGLNHTLEYSTTSFPSTGDITFDIFIVENVIVISTRSSASICANSYVQDRRVITTITNETLSNAVRIYGGNTIYNENYTGYRLGNTNYQGGGGAINARIDANDLTVASFSNTGLNIQSSSKFLLFSPNDVISPAQYTETYIQEAVFYLSDQSSNRTGIEDNINDFYSIY